MRELLLIRFPIFLIDNNIFVFEYMYMKIEIALLYGCRIWDSGRYKAICSLQINQNSIQNH